MRRLSALVRGAAGLTLVETMAALLVFAIMTLGTVPLLATSLRGTDRARSGTLGKNLAQQAVERIRGLPYFISYGVEASKVDVLDLYFPDKTSAGYKSADQLYETICSPGTATRSCPAGLPTGYTLTYRAAFVQPGALVGGQETYQVVAPPDGYTWEAIPTVNPGKDLPPTQLLRMSVIATWTVGGTERDFELTTLVGERKINEDKVRGSGRVNYGAQVLTTFISGGQESDLVATAGTSESRIESRVLASASQTVRTGDIGLNTVATETQPATAIDSFIGALSQLTTPPDQSSAGTTKTGESVTHSDPNIGDVAFLDDSSTSGLSVAVANELPIASGAFAVTSEGTTFDSGFWVDNQALVGTESPLLLSGTQPVFRIAKGEGAAAGATAMNGSTSAQTGHIVTDRRVQTTAEVKFGPARLYPVTFNSGGVVRVSDFTAKAECKTGASALAAPTYSASLQFHAETATQLNDGTSGGGYVTIPLGGSNTSDPLDTYFKTPTVIAGDLSAHPNASNPMVWEAPADLSANGSELDTYLFPVRHEHVVTDGVCVVCHNHAGYLESWDSDHSSSGTIGPGGVTATASIQGAVTINTAPSDPARRETSLTISLGSVSCEAVDRR